MRLLRDQGRWALVTLGRDIGKTSAAAGALGELLPQIDEQQTVTELVVGDVIGALGSLKLHPPTRLASLFSGLVDEVRLRMASTYQRARSAMSSIVGLPSISRCAPVSFERVGMPSDRRF